jgi:glycine hydroxymethyltransferase
MDEDAMRQVGDLIYRVVEDHDDPAVLEAVSEEVDALCADYPLYDDL